MTVSVTRQKCGYFNQATQLNSITPALITILAIGLIITKIVVGMMTALT